MSMSSMYVCTHLRERLVFDGGEVGLLIEERRRRRRGLQAARRAVTAAAKEDHGRPIGQPGCGCVIVSHSVVGGGQIMEWTECGNG